MCLGHGAHRPVLDVRASDRDITRQPNVPHGLFHPPQRMPTQFEDLPKFTITRITTRADNTEIHGRFDQMRGVRAGWCWLLSNAESIKGKLLELDDEAQSASFVASNPPNGTVGETFRWLDGYWPASVVRLIASPETRWVHRRFEASDAVAYVKQGLRCWCKASLGRSAGRARGEIIKGGWDHEHCEICNRKIGESGEPFGYVDSQDHWLCEKCYAQYAEQHDISFVDC